MAFEYPSPFKVNSFGSVSGSSDDPNFWTKLDKLENQGLFRKFWDIIDDTAILLQQRGFAYSERGLAEAALKQYNGVNLLYYMLFIAQAAKARIGILGLAGVEGNGHVIDATYQLTCIDENLPCLSAELGVDLTGLWNSILELFGIDRSPIQNTDCCLGIGEMVLGLDNNALADTEEAENDADCGAFIVGPCSLIDAYRPDGLEEKGEFSLGEFEIGDFTNFNE